MRYTILLHYPEMTPDDLGAGGWEEGQREFHAYATALDQAGVLISAEVLQPSSSTTTVAVRDGELRIQVALASPSSRRMVTRLAHEGSLPATRRVRVRSGVNVFVVIIGTAIPGRVERLAQSAYVRLAGARVGPETE